MKKINLGNNWNGNQTIIHVDDDEIISTDVRPAWQVQTILDQNKEKRALGRAPNKEAHGRHVASIPMEIYHEWKKEHAICKDSVDWKSFVKSKLNDPDNAFLRTNEMHL